MKLSQDDDLFPTATIGNLKPTFTGGRQARHVGVQHEVVREVEDRRTLLALLHLEATDVRRQQWLAWVEERVDWERGRAHHGGNNSHPGLGRSHHGHCRGDGVSGWS